MTELTKDMKIMKCHTVAKNHGITSVFVFPLKSGGFPDSKVVNNLPNNAGDTGLIPGPRPTCCRATKPMRHNY